MSDNFDYNDPEAVIAQGDLAVTEKRHVDAEKWYSSAYTLLSKAHGYLDVAMLAVLQKLAAASLSAYGFSNDRYTKQALNCLRLHLAISEREHGLDSPELIPVLTDLVQVYDFDGAHMLAIEVKQRIDDILERQALTS